MNPESNNAGTITAKALAGVMSAQFGRVVRVVLKIDAYRFPTGFQPSNPVSIPPVSSKEFFYYKLFVVRRLFDTLPQ